MHTKTTPKQLGIWMDHANAHVMEVTADSIETKNIGSEFTHNDKQESLNRNENLMHNKEKQHLGAYYKGLGDIILHYDEVLLFGPTTAKNELLNVLKDDHRFEKIAISTKDTDKISAHEQQLMLKEHFAKH